MPFSTSTQLRIAVLLIPPVQLLDLSPIDLFFMLSKEYLNDCPLPAPLRALGLDTVKIHYVGENGPPTSLSSQTTATTTTTSATATAAPMTASLSVLLTDNLVSPAVQPGQVDILLVPGPDPGASPSEPVQAFIRAHAEARSTTIMSVCTGVIPLAKSGILEGRICTGPRGLIGLFLRRDFPGAQWVDDKRWVVDVRDGKHELWTAGGITNGLDMVAEYIRRNFGRELADMVCAMADVGERGQEYPSGKAREGMWWGWLLLRSWLGGLFSNRSSQPKAGKEAK